MCIQLNFEEKWNSSNIKMEYNNRDASSTDGDVFFDYLNNHPKVIVDILQGHSLSYQVNENKEFKAFPIMKSDDGIEKLKSLIEKVDSALGDGKLIHLKAKDEGNSGFQVDIKTQVLDNSNCEKIGDFRFFFFQREQSDKPFVCETPDEQS